MSVSLREETMVLPTYEVGPVDVNPLFLEGRVYQGSSGKVYPWPVIEEVTNEKVMKPWTMVILENRWLEVWILPALGGRIHRMIDKTNGADVVYYNRVIKPALVGLLGPWISGGIEFNWPQHHRPSTFSPVEYVLRDHEDGSKSVVVSEVDRMNGTKGEAVFTLRPDRAVLDVEGRLSNPTAFPQTFLWWANPAVAAHEHTQSVFPPDVRAVMDHGKRDTSRFPVATGVYYKTDYSAGVDISWYKNIPVPTSYMVWKSDYDFVGAYDHRSEAGLLHVADHHFCPGKKQWTWGHGDFGRAWDRHLTDEDGPYIELMTGAFTDNQPDFTWLEPHEEKTFHQHFFPYKGLGVVQNATEEAALRLSDEDGVLGVGVYVTRPRGVRILVRDDQTVWLDVTVDLTPEAAWIRAVPEAPSHRGLSATVTAGETVLVSYRPAPEEPTVLPQAAPPMGAPADLPDAEALWLAGQHLEQYRHATFRPEDYYREGLRRSPRDLRLHGALGLWLLRRGLFAEAEAHLRTALATLTQYNQNPRDGELSFHLGTTLKAQGRLREAEAAWAKAAWSAAWQDAAFLELGRLATARGDWPRAEDFCRRSLARNAHNFAARHLLAVVLRHQSKPSEAGTWVTDTLTLDPLEFGSLREACLLGLKNPDDLASALRREPRNLLVLAGTYAAAGLFGEAWAVTEDHPEPSDALTAYHRAFWLAADGREVESQAEAARAAALGPELVFPHRLEDLAVLEWVGRAHPDDGRARLYGGHWLYDHGRYAEAAQRWEEAVQREPGLATGHRNLALAWYNHLDRPADALRSLETAWSLRPHDARILFELDLLSKKQGVSPSTRLSRLHDHRSITLRRDDLTVEYASLLNRAGREDEALRVLETRPFHPWEGGEGKVIRQFVRSRLGLAYGALGRGQATEALAFLGPALDLPVSLGEQRLPGFRDSSLWYALGLAHFRAGDKVEADRWWQRAAEGTEKPSSTMFYNDNPPEMIFYQGLARLRLGDRPGALGRFHSLIDYGEGHLRDEVVMDYFAVSLPDFSLFHDDLNQRNRVQCRFLIGLGLWGRGDRDAAWAQWDQCLTEEPSHEGAWDHRAWSQAGMLDPETGALA